jgi:SEL1 protein
LNYWKQFSKYAYPRNYHHAFTYYDELASKGNATAQQMLGFIYSTGIGNTVKRDQARALLYHTFAAHGGDTAAQMTMGYRYLLGIGTDETCEDALYHYKNVASKVIDYYLSGPPGGYTPPLSKVRLSEENGGVYGYGASVTTEKRSRHPGGAEKSVSIDEILQYWRYLAAKQDVDAQLMLGQVYYLGTRSIRRDFNEAFMFFNQIVDKVSSGGKVPAKSSKAIGQAAGYLGLMYWRGEGVKTNAKTAHKWFELGVELGDSTSQNSLGMMYLDGIVVPKNRDKAIEYFKKAADQENPNAQVNLAIEYAQTEASMPLSIRLFTKAADAKHLLAYWYLAHMNEQSITPRSSCRVAVSVNCLSIREIKDH